VFGFGSLYSLFGWLENDGNGNAMKIDFVIDADLVVVAAVVFVDLSPFETLPFLHVLSSPN
jgi:hypothetical protein